MARFVQLAFDPDAASWAENEVWGEDGVLGGYVSLRLRSHKVLDYASVGLNNSALSLAKTLTDDHAPVRSETEAMAAVEPLFFCAGAIPNRCGVLYDFRVQHIRGQVVLSEFWQCNVPTETEIVVPWPAWADAVVKFGTRIIRRLPKTVPPVVVPNWREAYSENRTALQAQLKRGRAILKGHRTPRAA